MANSAIRALLGTIILVFGAQLSGSVEAAEIKALITIGVQSAIEDLAPKFERATGHKVVTVFGLSAALSKRVGDGEPTDVFIGTREGVNGLIQAATISAGSDATLASSGIGVAARAGTPKPDISTPDHDRVLQSILRSHSR